MIFKEEFYKKHIYNKYSWEFFLNNFIVIQSCSVDPIPEKDVMSKFDNRNVAESIVRYVFFLSLVYSELFVSGY